jgi:EAL domain-containing protein (putative c-di-GMP-specific phosphodiesterase class I)
MCDLRQAVSHRELEVHYQPKVSLASGMIVGVEALLRWRHPVLGLLAPALFLSLAEETGVSVDMGLWLLEEVCRQAEEWLEPGYQTTIAINISPLQLQRLDLLGRIFCATARHSIPVQTIELELTKPLVLWDEAKAGRELARLRDGGVRITLDNVDEANFNLKLLKCLPLDALKIDPAVIRTMGDNSDSHRFIEKFVALARQLGLDTVAVGVEREYQAQHLKELGCRAAQGDYYTKPSPIHQLEYWMEGKI